MTEQPDLAAHVAYGIATDDELAEFFGPDLMNQLAAQWRGPEHTQHLFTEWYVDVMRPIDIGVQSAMAVFTGEITIEAFTQSLDEKTLNRFVELFPELQAAHQERIDRGEVR